MRLTLCAVIAAMLACGDDDGGADTGTPDTGTDSATDVGDDTGADADVETTTIRLRYLDADDAPLADVKIRVDTAAGSVEGISGADGVIEMDVPAVVGEEVTITTALEGHIIVTGYQVPLPVEVTGDTPFDGTLSPISTDAAPTFRITATGVPAGGHICTSLNGFHFCNAPGAEFVIRPPAQFIGEFANIWLLDDADAAIDFERVAIPPGATSLDVTFDGVFETAAATRTVTIEIPADGGSMLSFDVDGVVRFWPGWFGLADVETGQFWSVASNLQRAGDDLTVDVAEMVPPVGTETRYSARIFSAGTFVANFSRYLADPGTTAPTMGLGTLAGDQLDQPITITPPAPVAGDTLQYILNVRSSASNVFWVVVTEKTNVEMPELPSAYDTSVSYPFPGASGTMLLRTRTAVPFGVDPLSPPLGSDFHSSQGETFPITF